MGNNLDWIFKALEKEGKSSSGLARALGVNPSQVTRMKKGERRLQINEIGKAAAYLGVPIPSDLARLSEGPDDARAPAPMDSVPLSTDRTQAPDDRRLRQLAKTAIMLALAHTRQHVERKEISAWVEDALRCCFETPER
jgi:transcriptional regulator with XRE-family HTH domain